MLNHLIYCSTFIMHYCTVYNWQTVSIHVYTRSDLCGLWYHEHTAIMPTKLFQPLDLVYSLPVQLRNPDITYRLFGQQLGTPSWQPWTLCSVTSDMQRLRKTITDLFTYVYIQQIIIINRYHKLKQLYYYSNCFWIVSDLDDSFRETLCWEIYQQLLGRFKSSECISCWGTNFGKWIKNLQVG